MWGGSKEQWMEMYNFQIRRKSHEKWGLRRCVKGGSYDFVCMSCAKKGTRILKRQQKPHLQFPCSQTAWTDRIDLRLRHSIYLISHWVLNLSITTLSHLKDWVKLLERFVDYQEFPINSFLLSATLLTYIGHRFVYSLPQSGYRTFLLAPQNDLMLLFIVIPFSPSHLLASSDPFLSFQNVLQLQSRSSNLYRLPLFT